MAEAALKLVHDDSSTEELAHAVLDPSVSVEAKLDAISKLKEISGQEARAALEQALLYVGHSRISQNTRALPPGGEVSGAAARALAHMPEVGGLQVLSAILFDERSSRMLREAAAYGLGGSLSPHAFSILHSGLMLSDPDIRYRILLSLRESLEHVTYIAAPHIEGILHCLVDLLLQAGDKGVSLESEMIGALLTRFASQRAEVRMAEILMRVNSDGVCASMVQIIRGRGTENSKRLLGRVLMSYGRPAFVYEQIGEELAGSCDPVIVEAAKGAVKHYTIWRRVVGVLSVFEKRGREAQIGAAYAIIGIG